MAEVLQTEHTDNDKVHYCSVDLVPLRFDVTFDDTLRDGSSKKYAFYELHVSYASQHTFSQNVC